MFRYQDICLVQCLLNVPNFGLWHSKWNSMKMWIANLKPTFKFIILCFLLVYKLTKEWPSLFPFLNLSSIWDDEHWGHFRYFNAAILPITTKENEGDFTWIKTIWFDVTHIKLIEKKCGISLTFDDEWQVQPTSPGCPAHHCEITQIQRKNLS